ncbi:recombinase family protein [Acidithiobacillus sp.]
MFQRTVFMLLSNSVFACIGVYTPCCLPLQWFSSLMERKIGLFSLNDPIDTTSAQGRFVFNLFASLTEFERELIRERTQAISVFTGWINKHGDPSAVSERFGCGSVCSLIRRPPPAPAGRWGSQRVPGRAGGGACLWRYRGARSPR